MDIHWISTHTLNKNYHWLYGHEYHKHKYKHRGLCFKACHFVIQSCVLLDYATNIPKFNKVKRFSPNSSKLYIDYNYDF